LLLFFPCVWREDMIWSSCNSFSIFLFLHHLSLSHEENLHYHIEQVFHDFWFIVYSGPMVWTQGPFSLKPLHQLCDF
jgi:hypothetical protein